MLTRTRSHLAFVVLAGLVVLPALAVARDPIDAENPIAVSEDGAYVAYDEVDTELMATRRMVESLLDGKREELHLEVDRGYGDAVDGLTDEDWKRLLPDMERAQSKTLIPGRRRWKAILARHPMVRFGSPGGSSSHGWEIRVDAPGCGLEHARQRGVELHAVCQPSAEVRLELVHGEEVRPWLTGKLETANELRLDLRWSADGQWAWISTNAGFALEPRAPCCTIAAAIPKIQLLGQDRGALEASARQLEQAGYGVAATGKPRDPHGQSELYYLQPFEAEARRIAALLGVAPDRVQPLTWQAQAPVVVVLAPAGAGAR